MKYVKKPVPVEVIQYRKDIPMYLYEMEKFIRILRHWQNRDCILIKTVKGEEVAMLGDYIIKHPSGKYSICKPDIFEQTYEKVNE